MKIAVDLRMKGKSGIGAFIDGVLPYLLESQNEFMLLGVTENSFSAEEKSHLNFSRTSFLPCQIPVFSIKETFCFPKQLSKIINTCDVFFTPYCNIPSGIKIPVFSTIHDIVFLDMPELAGKAGTFIRKIFYIHAVRKSKEILSVSNFSRERIIEKLHCKKNINVVYSAIPDYFVKKITPFPAKTDSIIFIGNIKKHKGLATLIPAFKLFLQKLANEGKSPAKLVIVGSQDNFRTADDSINSLFESLPQGSVEFTGYISDDELKMKLSQAKILVQPSFYEGFGLPPLQALYTSTIPVISDIPVFKEIYEKLPVTFFQTGNEKDLAEKIAENWNKKAPENIPELYTFKNTAELILKAFSH